jgi:prepilin signal peptidase PulO-like enzyme (type II secretory pathway)
LKKQQQSQNIGQIALIFMGVSVGIFLIAALISVLILSLSEQFTYWALLPIIISFPITFYLNTVITRRTIAGITKSYIVAEETSEEENTDEVG